MSEMAKTIAFVAVAAGSLLLAFVVRSNVDQFDVESLVGERLNNEFEVSAVKRLKIIKFDSETANTREFEVAAVESLWTIPSKQDYPADAAQQMAEAATCLIDREVLRVAGKDASQHQELGVVDPSSSDLNSKAEGVGIRVTMTDINDSTLTDMIIGKPVKDAEGQYHVRNVDQDVVYVVPLNPEKLSTRFEDWIEDDLLKLNPMDIQRVHIKDYSIEMQPVFTGGGVQMQIGWDRRGEISLSYDNAESKWLPDSLLQYDAEKKELVAYTLAEDEELSSEVLTELRNGLDELLLVDVERKPDGLSTDLKAGEGFLNNDEAINSLMQRGFAPVPTGSNGEAEILSSEGEIICTLKDGVEYVLRFGNLKVDGESASPADAAQEGAEDAKAGIHRYLFVMARLNELAIEKPELAELPALPEETPPAETPEEKPAEEAATEETPVEEAPAEAVEETEESDTEETTEPSAEENNEAAEATEEPAAEEPAAEETPEVEATEEEKAANLEEIIAARKSIEQENQRREDEYQDKIKAAEERVQELNERFGDWYYVISNDVYKKLHLDREKLITKKKDPAEQPAAGAPAGFPAGGIPGLPNLPGSN